MPHFTLPIDVKGPILNIVFNVSEARAQALKNAGLSIPDDIIVKGMVDTGTSNTCVDPTVIKALEIPASGEIKILTPSTGSNPVSANQYDIALRIFGPSTHEPPYRTPNLAVVESELFKAQGFHALIGRDVLSKCIFSYNGAAKLYTLAF